MKSGLAVQNAGIPSSDAACKAVARTPSTSVPVMFSEPEVAEQVHHDGGVCCCVEPERQPGHHARLLLELRCHAGVDRVVAAELCGRGAISLTTSALSRARRTRRTARRRSRARATIGRVASPWHAARGPATRAGSDRHVEDAVAVLVLGDRGTPPPAPSKVRATITDTSIASGEHAFEHAGHRPHGARTRPPPRPRVATRAWPLPS
jgi:hypothetical protein